MNVWLIAFKNLLRKKVRFILTVFAVSVAVAVLVSLIGFDKGYQRSLNNDVEKMGYQLLVTAKGCPYAAAILMLKGEGGLKTISQSVYDKISADKRVDKITPQLQVTLYDKSKANGQGAFVVYMGIQKSFMELKPWIKFKQGEWFSSEEAEEIILGYNVAQTENKKIGDDIKISSIDKVLKVQGIWERSNTQDDNDVYLPLQTAQRIFEEPNKLTGVGIKLKDVSMIAAFEEDLFDEPGIQIISMAQVKGTIYNLISSARTMTNSVALIAIFVAIIGIVNTILMSVFERTREIGVMKAMGASRFDVFKIIWVETTVICVIGGVIGNILAILGTNLVEYIIRKILPYVPSGQLVYITFDVLLYSFIGTLILGFLAGIYPALKASSMRPIEAIRWVEL